MSEEKALILAQPRDVTSSKWDSIMSVANVVAGMYGMRPAEAAMAMLRGWELGIPISAAIETVFVISSKKGQRTSLSAQLINALIHRSKILKKMDFKRLENDKHQCIGYEVYMERIDGSSWKGSFTQADAEQAGLLTKDNWKNYDDDMYFSRAMTKVGRRVFPDVLLGMYTPEELDANVSAESVAPATTVEGSFTIVEPEGKPKEPEGPSMPQTLVDLMDKKWNHDGWTATDVMTASTAAGIANTLPVTPEEVAKVYAELTKSADEEDQKEAKE